ncbi:MAG TPA: hypothetical protein PKY05_08555 [Fibrobacteria bacterium]|nr:hypothetical protein [Fibrobacteria bacterium]
MIRNLGGNLRDPLLDVTFELFQATPFASVRGNQSVLQDGLGVHTFDPGRIGNPERSRTPRIPRGCSDRSLVEQKPSLAHPHRHHGNMDRTASDRSDRHFDLLVPPRRILSFRIAMHEQDIHFAPFHPFADLVRERPGRPRHPPKLGTVDDDLTLQLMAHEPFEERL